MLKFCEVFFCELSEGSQLLGRTVQPATEATCVTVEEKERISFASHNCQKITSYNFRIYRDEVYTPGSQRQGIADIIVAKHRNGPTGTFCLRFEPQTHASTM